MRQEKRTSANWLSLPDYPGITVLDPDGWDRQNFQFSWYEEKITKEEFERRLGFSTSVVNRK